MDKETGEEICASIPDDNAPGEMTADVADKIIDRKISGHDALTNDPETGKPIYVLTGRYGPYVQLGDAAEEGEKPKRMALPPNLTPEEVDEKKAVFLLSLPKHLGDHPDSGKPVRVGIGRFGPYVVHDGDFRSIPKSDSVFDIDFEKAMALLNQPKKGRGRAAPIKELGPHPETGDEIQVLSGKYGPYVKCGRVNVSLPEKIKPEEATKEQVLELLEQKMAAKGKKKTKKSSEKKKTAKKKTVKKSAKKNSESVTKKAKSAKKKAKKTAATPAKKTEKKSNVIRRSAK
ncbi:MAG: topoisomerase C-terminal repeat-containing protein [Bdellovibrionales bacterium]